MTSPHGRRIQTRRALAILAWGTLAVVAWLLWYGQRNNVIRIQAWEPAALVLSAYATFLSIFGWMLFSPNNSSAEESPGLFFSGMLTLIPPCFIAYNLMPEESPLRPWLTIGVFLFGVLAIISPLPKEVFAVPRDRKTYLQPLTDGYLSELKTDAPEIRFDNLLPKTQFWLTQPQQNIASPTTARDPWADPFYGTGRQMSRIGVSQSRRYESTDEPADVASMYENERQQARPDSRYEIPRAERMTERMYDSGIESRRSEPQRFSDPTSLYGDVSAREISPRGPSISMPQIGSRRPLTEPGQGASRSPASPSILPVNVPSIPIPAAPSSAYSPPPLPANALTPTSKPAAPQPSMPPRNEMPLRYESSQRNESPKAVGFQSPSPAFPPLTTRPTTDRSAGSANSGSANSGSANSGSANSGSANSGSTTAGSTGKGAVTNPLKSPISPGLSSARPISEPPRTTIQPMSTDAIASLASGMLGGQVASSVANAAKVAEPIRPLVDGIEARAAEVRSIMESVQRPDTSTIARPLADLSAPPRTSSPPQTPIAPSSSARTSPSLQDLDRELQQLADLEDEENAVAARLAETPASSSGRTVQQNGDVKMERITDEHGGEMIEGTIRVFFEVGQKKAHLHVPFSPPLAGQPEVECEPIHDDGVRVKVAVRQPYGIRIEARRAEAGKSLNSEVSFAVVYTSGN